jgi:hypothetical protein
MKPKYVNGNMRAACPDCGGAVTTFESKSATGGAHGTVIRNWPHVFEGRNYIRAFFILMQCAGCGRGGLATIHDNGTGGQAFDELFYPASRDLATLPPNLPTGVEAEYREAELCASVGGWRAASALLRSALEKTLKANGYAAGSLKQRIDDAAKDGVITAARRQRAHEDVRVLGNDILHDDWRAVTEDEYSVAHHYVQRILEDFYDHRAEVEATLRAAKRIPAAPPGP